MFCFLLVPVTFKVKDLLCENTSEYKDIIAMFVKGAKENNYEISRQYLIHYREFYYYVIFHVDRLIDSTLKTDNFRFQFYLCTEALKL